MIIQWAETKRRPFTVQPLETQNPAATPAGARASPSLVTQRRGRRWAPNLPHQMPPPS